MDMLPSKYIKVSYFCPQIAKKSCCLLRVSKKLKKLKKILEFLFHKTNSKYHMNCANIKGPSDDSG